MSKDPRTRWTRQQREAIERIVNCGQCGAKATTRIVWTFSDGGTLVFARCDAHVEEIRKQKPQTRVGIKVWITEDKLEVLLS